MAGSRRVVGYYNREKLPAKIHPSLLPPQLPARTHKHTHMRMMCSSLTALLSLTVYHNMISDGLIQITDY